MKTKKCKNVNLENNSENGYNYQSIATCRSFVFQNGDHMMHWKNKKIIITLQKNQSDSRSDQLLCFQLFKKIRNQIKLK